MASNEEEGIKTSKPSYKDLRETMPCGFDAKTSALLNYTEAEKRPHNILPVDKMSENQKQRLTLACWDHPGCWDDVIIDGDYKTKKNAIKAVKEGTAVGKELVRLTMMGYNHIYGSFLPHDEEKYPLPKIMILWPRDKHPSTIASFTAHNHCRYTVYIYKQRFENKYSHVEDIAESDFKSLTPDFTGQVWVAHASKDTQSKVLGSFVAYPGCTRWDIFSTATGTSFLASARNADIRCGHITNNLKTYANIWYVNSFGNLIYINTIPPHFPPHFHCYRIEPCYVGMSLVATQGNKVISEFFVSSEACTKWSIGRGIPPGGEEIYATGNNNYIFYQVITQQDDTVPVAPLPDFTKQITISSGTQFLYASLFDSNDAYFAAPSGVTVAIKSTDISGTTRNYNTDTNTDNFYVEMTANGSLQKLCVKNPTDGQWKITITAHTNTPVHFQFQTVPTSDPYTTMQATLSSGVLGANWEDVAYSGFANIANNTQHPAEGDAVTAVGVALVGGSQEIWKNTSQTIQNSRGDIVKATNALTNAATLVPPGLKTVLLVDANGANKATKTVYASRNKYVYPEVKSGKYRDSHETLIGEKEAKRKIFRDKLQDTNVRYVSVAGHGNVNAVCGYSPVGTQREILTTAAVNLTPELAKGKIFHMTSCCTANELGPALVAKGATAFIGYNDKYFVEAMNKKINEPDCIIDRELLNGKTVNEAVEISKAKYRQYINKAPTLFSTLEKHHNALTVLGDGDGTL